MCNQCIHEGICRYVNGMTELERGLKELIQKCGSAVFYAQVHCRHYDKNPVSSGVTAKSVGHVYDAEQGKAI